MGSGGKAETQKISENMGNLFICMYFFVCPGAPSNILAGRWPHVRIRAELARRASYLGEQEGT
eukprot:8777975-Pyramimonas_sp.AAC.1